MMSRIFICYRRRDSDYPAQHIYAELSHHFGADSVVFDVDSVPLGVDFRQYLNDQVSQCDVLLAVIGDKWLSLLDEHPDGEPDFVRIEIEAALKRDIPVVPVLVESASMPKAASLPDDIKDFAWRNAAEVRGGADLRLHLERLVRQLERQLKAQEAKRAAEAARKEAEAERRRKDTEAKREAEEEERRKAEQARQQAEAERKRRDEEAKRAAEEERRRQAEQEAKRKAEEEERRKVEEARKQADAERRRRDEEAKRVAEEEARRRAEQEAKRKAEEEARHREGETRTGEPVKPSAPPSAPPTAPSARSLSMTRFLVALGVIGSLLIVGVMIFQKEQPPSRSAPPERPPGTIEFSREAELARQLEEARRAAEAERQRQADLARRLEVYERQRLDKLQGEEAEGQRAEQRVAELFALGTKAEKDKRLTTPAHDNAVAYYREVLNLDPGNEAARLRLERVVQTYIDWAQGAIGAHQFDKAEDYLARARSVDPDHPGIRRLAVELDRIERLRAQSAKRPPAVRGEGFHDKLKDGSKGPEMVVIPAGSFRMGDIQGAGDKDELPVHPVRIAKPFAIGKYEVTFEEYDRFAKATGRALPEDQGWGRGRRPVINVSWHDAVAYTEWLSEQTGKRYRLPSEAEWEYAARGGTETAYWWGNQMKAGMANCNDCGSQWDDNQTAPVGSFAANPFGLHDTAGNVREWVQDCWHSNYEGAPKDGSPWEAAAGGNCGWRVLPGGSWSDRPENLRSAYRYGNIAGVRYDFIGFRLAQDLD